MVKVWACIRSVNESWQGALIIVAESGEKARDIFFDREDTEPAKIKELDLSNEGVIYEDEAR